MKYGDVENEWPVVGKFVDSTTGPSILTGFSADKMPTLKEIIKSTYAAAHKSETKKISKTEKVAYTYMYRTITLPEFRSKHQKTFQDYILDHPNTSMIIESITYVPQWDSFLPFANMKLIYDFIMEYRNKKIKKDDLEKRFPPFKREMDKCLSYTWAYHAIHRNSDRKVSTPKIGQKCIVEFPDPNFVSYGKFLKNV